MLRIGLIGDYQSEAAAHDAIPRALALAGEETSVHVSAEWVPTEEIRSTERITELDGIWCVPASPYRNMEGALLAIGFARAQCRPFLGTCGGFQHAVVEYARSVLGWVDADHAETAPDARRPVIVPLACSLVEAAESVFLCEGSKIAQAYGRLEVSECYHCRYGVNPSLRPELFSGPLRITAEDALGEVRAVELDGHPFFVATLFQPERSALSGRVPPLVVAFLRSAAQSRRSTSRSC